VPRRQIDSSESEPEGEITPVVVALVGCGKRKAAHSPNLPAKDLYIGAPFRLALNYALRTADDVLILSALHGVISPFQRIAPYDVVMPQKTIPEQYIWGRDVVAELRTLYPMTRIHIVFYAGMQYIRPIMKTLPEEKHYWTWENPLAGKDLFTRIRWLKEKLDALPK
jgi:hypothetical protein